MTQLSMFELPEVPKEERPSVQQRLERDQTFYYLARRVEGAEFFLWKFEKGHAVWIKTDEARHRKPKRYKVLARAQLKAKQYHAEVKLWKNGPTPAPTP